VTAVGAITPVEGAASACWEQRRRLARGDHLRSRRLVGGPAASLHREPARPLSGCPTSPPARPGSRPRPPARLRGPRRDGTP